MYKEKKLIKLGLFIFNFFRRLAKHRKVPCNTKVESLTKTSNLCNFNLSRVL